MHLSKFSGLCNLMINKFKMQLQQRKKNFITPKLKKKNSLRIFEIPCYGIHSILKSIMPNFGSTDIHNVFKSIRYK